MSKTMRRVAVAAALTTFAVVTADALVVPAFAKRKECVRTAAWVAKHANDLPSTLQALAAYPVSYRRAIFAALAPEVRSNLYLEQYRQFAASRSLTARQLAILAEATSLAAPAYYAANGKHDAETLSALASLSARIAVSFSPEDRKVFYQLGPDKPSGVAPRALLLRLQGGLRSLFVAHAQSLDCDCIQGGSDCSPSYTCIDFGCDPVNNCGVNNWAICDGMCWKPGF